MDTVVWIALVLASTLVALHAWRIADEGRAARAWRRLARSPAGPAALFDPAMVAALPEPVRRYFQFTIAPGTPLRMAAVINTVGEIGLGTRERPNYLPMCAQQVLAPPYGLVWKLKAGRRGLLRITGSDGFDGRTSWVRFWLLGTLPIVRAGGNADHARAAFGRVVAEAVFWAPAALLPGDHVRWEAAAENVARATVSHGGMVQSVDVTLADDGRPTLVVIPRWSNANPERRYRVQPFGGYLSGFGNFGGYRLPTRVEGGNFIGTDAYFAFYKVRVEDLRFIDAG